MVSPTTLMYFVGFLVLVRGVTDEVSSPRKAKFFSLFTIIRFLNTDCGGVGSFTGTCFTRRECNDLDGTVIGRCASKKGVCCVVQRTCGGASNVNNTYFTNRGYPSSFNAAGRCTITIRRCNPDICQLRLDFLDFSLYQPNGTGECTNDYMSVTGGSSQVPRICGENLGQHIYINFDGDNPITITIATNIGLNFNRRWNIRLMQIACNCPTIAPSGCLMYYTGTSGSVKSFNYGVMQNEEIQQFGSLIVGTRELANLNYGICVRMEAGYCGIVWSQGSDLYSFTVTGDVPGLGTLVGTPGAQLSGINCTTDFIVIPNPIGEITDRFCGTGLAPKTTYAKPFVLTVVTNGNEGPPPPDVGNRGFFLNYQQRLCPTV